MDAIIFIMKKEIKNSFFELLHHPGKLVLYLFIIGLLGMSVVTSAMEPSKIGTGMNIGVLHGAYFVILLFITIMSLLMGMKSGTTFFKMSDVNFLFVSPISPKKVLSYGLVKQMASSLLMMLFLVFYGAMLINNFGISWTDVILLLLGLAVVVFLTQVLTLLVYSFTNGKPQRVTAVKTCLYLFVALALVIIGQTFLTNGSNLDALYTAAKSPYLQMIPVAGWIKGMVFSLMDGEILTTVIYGAITMATIAVGIIAFEKSDTDYYEDVLQSTESTFEVKNAAKNGRTGTMNGINSRKIQVTDTGIRKGWGANTFFYKHLREAKRKSRLAFISTSTILVLVLNVFLVFLVKKLSEGDSEAVTSGQLMAIALGASVYVLFFMNAAGSWTSELMKHYIYLVPEKPFKKLIWASMSTIVKPAIDGVIIFTVVCILAQANPLTAIICMICYAGFGFLFVACNVLSQRLFGQMANKGLLMFAYMLMLILVMAPGITGSVLLMTLAKGVPEFVIGLPMAVWNVLVSLGIFAACRNILDTVELNN